MSQYISSNYQQANTYSTAKPKREETNNQAQSSLTMSLDKRADSFEADVLGLLTATTDLLAALTSGNDLSGATGSEDVDTPQNADNTDPAETTESKTMTPSLALTILKNNMSAFASSDAEGNKTIISQSDLRAVYHNEDTSPEMRDAARYLMTNADGKEAWQAFDGATGTAGDNQISLNELQDINIDSLVEKGKADNIKNAEEALLELSDPELVKQLHENSNSQKVEGESQLYGRTALQKLASGEGDFAKSTQSQRDAAAYLLAPGNKALLDDLDTNGGKDEMDQVYSSKRGTKLLDKPDLLKEILNGGMPASGFTNGKQVASVLADKPSLQRKLHQASGEDYSNSAHFDITALEALAAGEGPFANATEAEKAAAQFYIDNEAARNEIDYGSPKGPDVPDGIFTTELFQNLKENSKVTYA
jgi:hypothetical protein